MPYPDDYNNRTAPDAEDAIDSTFDDAWCEFGDSVKQHNRWMHSISKMSDKDQIALWDALEAWRDDLKEEIDSYLNDHLGNDARSIETKDAWCDVPGVVESYRRNRRIEIARAAREFPLIVD